MNCMFCGGNHSSVYCPGFNSYSMNKTLSEINLGIDNLSEFNEKSLDLASERNSKIFEIQNELAENNQILSDNLMGLSSDISGALNNLSDISDKGYEQISNSIFETGEKIFNSNITAAEIMSTSIIGIGAILQYRERMEKLRFKIKMNFKEEKSISGIARRELMAASAIVFAGDPIQAEKHLDKSISLYPLSAETYRIKSIIESIKGKHNDSIISLKTALSFTNNNYLYPYLNLTDNKIAIDEYEKIKVSIISQLSQEYSIINQIDNALSILNNAIIEFPNNTDLHFQRLRTLSKHEQWLKKFEEYIFEILMLSSKYYNLIYLDFQLISKKNDIQRYLKSIFKDKKERLNNLTRVLLALSEGKSEKANALNYKNRIDSLSYTSIVKYIDEIQNEINSIKVK